MRERVVLRQAGLHILIAAAIGAVVATIGPFGTFVRMPTGARYLYWLIIIPLNWAQILAAVIGLVRWSAAARWPETAVVSAGCVIASVPAAFEVLLLEAWLGPPGHAPPAFLGVWPYVVLLSLVIALPVIKIGRGVLPLPNAAPAVRPAAGPTAPNFLGRVPRHVRGAPLCLASEDHYLRVHTAAGSALILYRLADAIEELAGMDGIQVHRSFWVAADAVAGVERSGRRVSLRLTNGLLVPVSRTFLAKVRAAGWLDRG